LKASSRDSLTVAPESRKDTVYLSVALKAFATCYWVTAPSKLL
jgi:hypothetical protein